VTTVDGVRLISNSEIQTFKACRRKWWLAWFRGMAPRKADLVGVRSIGTRIHACLAEYYVPDGESRIDPLITHVRIAAEDLAALRENAAREGYEVDAEQLQKLNANFELERVMLAGYMDWLRETGADANLEVVGSEVYIETLFTPDVKLIGKIDTRVRDRRTGRRKFLDHKSVASLDTSLLRLNEQMLHYHLLEWLETEEGESSCDGALYNMMKRSKRTARATPPFYHRAEITHNSHELESYRKRLMGVVMDIEEVERKLEAGEAHHQVVYPTPSRDCSWKCPFVKICPLFDDGSRSEDALANLFVHRNPLDYYQGAEREEEQ
jgi:hypothetical protein